MSIDHFEKLKQAELTGSIPKELAHVIYNFYLSYGEAIEENGYLIKDIQPILNKFLDFVIDQLAHPFTFKPFHERITTPFNYYQFGLDLMRPLVVTSQSRVLGSTHIDTIEAALSRKENVILLANHQTEPDPQAISILLEKTHSKLAEEMIFVAGHRVITDPLAVPLSKGRNLLCIFSKRHIETEPQLKQEKLLHNQHTMKKMIQLLNEGGKCIYVAPSGGRDRPCPQGMIDVAPFDPQSIEMFWLMTKQSDRATHFYPLALATYKLLPPPNGIKKDLGERRHTHCTPIHLAFGQAIDMENCISNLITDKKLRRKERASFIWNLVVHEYAKIR